MRQASLPAEKACNLQQRQLRPINVNRSAKSHTNASCKLSTVFVQDGYRTRGDAFAYEEQCGLVWPCITPKWPGDASVRDLIGAPHGTGQSEMHGGGTHRRHSRTPRRISVGRKNHRDNASLIQNHLPPEVSQIGLPNARGSERSSKFTEWPERAWGARSSGRETV